MVLLRMLDILQDELQSEKASDSDAGIRKDTCENTEETLVFC